MTFIDFIIIFHMEPRIDKEISKAESVALQQQNAALMKQNELLKKELSQVKSMQANTQK